MSFLNKNILELYFDQSYTFLLILISAVFAALISFLGYRNKEQKALFTLLQLNLLSILRFISIFVLLFLILGPAIRRYKQIRQQSVLIVAVDNSQSIESFKSEAEQFINQIETGLDNYKLEFWTFGEEASNSDTVTYDDVRSDYSNLIQSVKNNYLLNDIGGIVILGDGIYNSGGDPVYESRNIPYPVYTVGIGDTITHKDIAIIDVTTNSTSYLNNFFPVQVDLSFTKADGQNTRLTIEKENEIVYETSLQIYGDDYFKQETINLQAEEEGINNYTLKIEPIDGEENTINNQYEFSINVVSEKQKILFLTHGSHPDISAIIQAIEENNSYEWDIQNLGNSDPNFTDYNLVILHQLPDATRESIQALEALKASRIPYLIFVGSETSIPRLNNLQTGIDIQPTNNTENASPVLNPSFGIFSVDEDFSEQIMNWPPLVVPFGNINIEGGLETVLFQKVQTINTDYPLISMGRINGVKRAYIVGDGMWRWRLYNYLQIGSHEVFDGIIKKMINYLIQKPNEDNFNIYFQTDYPEDSPITMQAELFNESYEPVNEPDVSIEIVSEDGTQYDYVFDKEDDQYALNVGNLPSATYSFTAKTKLGEQSYSEIGSFHVSPVQIEQSETTANFQVLYQIAENTGGNFFTYNEFSQLKNTIDQNNSLEEKKIRQQVYQDFIDLKWLFFVILIILSLEWFLRKFWGSY